MSEQELLSPTAFVSAIKSACDPSNWDADLNQGDYFRGLRDAYEIIGDIAYDYQRSMYDWTMHNKTLIMELDKALREVEICRARARATYTFNQAEEKIARAFFGGMKGIDPADVNVSADELIGVDLLMGARAVLTLLHKSTKENEE